MEETSNHGVQDKGHVLKPRREREEVRAGVEAGGRMGRVAGDTKPRGALAHPIPGIPPRGAPETQKTDPEDKNVASWKAGMGRNGRGPGRQGDGGGHRWVPGGVSY